MPDVRDQIIDYINYWRERAEMPDDRLVGWIGITRSKYHAWRSRYGKANEHNASVPRDQWLEVEEKAAIIKYAQVHPLDGYRRLAFMMLDENIVAVSPSSVYRVLQSSGLMSRKTCKPSLKGTGFVQPLRPHEHWHIDVSYINIRGTFYYLCAVLDGCSRFIVEWELREQMREPDIEIILQKARERVPDARPRVISDNGPQFVARDFKEFIRLSGMTHVKTSPYYPQSNGKIERWHQTLKVTAIRPKTPLTLESARQIVSQFVVEYNERRLHSAIGYVTPQAKLEGREQQIFKDRDRKLEAARAARAVKRQQARSQDNYLTPEVVNSISR
jgi:transposase InsO family protein